MQNFNFILYFQLRVQSSSFSNYGLDFISVIQYADDISIRRKTNTGIHIFLECSNYLKILYREIVVLKKF